MADAQRVLGSLVDLMEREKVAVAVESDATMLAIDQEIERLFGEKERTMGALQQHRAEHGC